MFDVKVDGSKLVKLLRRFERAGGDLTPAMQVIAEQLVSAVNDEFESAGRGRWPALEASTIARRRKKGRGAQILKDTGRLAASIRGDAGSDWAMAATDVGYAVYHVSHEPRRVIPLRNFFDVPETVIEDAAQTLLDMLTQAFAEAGQ